MANKRRFKKNAEKVGATICLQLIDITNAHPEIDSKITDDCVGKILRAIETARNRSNHFFGSVAEKEIVDEKLSADKVRKEFFKLLFINIKNDFSGTLSEVLKEFNDALPASVRESNKAKA